MKSAFACGAAALLLSAASAAETEMFEFIPSCDSPDNVVNMSHLLAAPAAARLDFTRFLEGVTQESRGYRFPDAAKLNDDFHVHGYEWTPQTIRL